MYDTELMRQILTSEAARDIVNQLSPIYGEARVALWLFQIIGAELDETRSWTQELMDQVTPHKATWSLDYWEDEFGIARDPSLSTDKRRERILSHLRNRAPMNPYNLSRIASAAANGAECQIIERVRYGSNFLVSVRLEPDTQISIGSIIKAVDISKQARLSFDVEFEVRWTIQIKSNIAIWIATPPPCGAIRCGTYPERSTLGWSKKEAITLSAMAEVFPSSPELCGTIPEVAAIGYSVSGKSLCAGAATEAYAADPPESGVENSGSVPQTSTLGCAIEAGIKCGDAPAAVYAGVPSESGVSRCGTLP